MSLKLIESRETLRLFDLEINAILMTMEEMAQKLAELEKQNGRK